MSQNKYFGLFAKLTRDERIEAVVMLMKKLNSFEEIDMVLQLLDLQLSNTASHSSIHNDEVHELTEDKVKNVNKEAIIMDDEKKRKEDNMRLNKDHEEIIGSKGKKIWRNLDLKCNQCAYSTKNKFNLQMHIEGSHGNIVYPCRHCDFKTTYQAYLKKHVRADHVIQEDRPKSTKSTKNNDEVHKLTEDKMETVNKEAIIMDDTKKRKRDNMQLNKDDQKIYIGSKGEIIGRNYHFKCNQCDYSAKKKFNLQMHIEGKHGNFVYTCRHCDFKTSWKSRLNKHVRADHVIQEDRPKSTKSTKTSSSSPKSKKSSKSLALYCYCRQPSSKDLLGCDFCPEWYHPKCLNISAAEARKLVKQDTWKCPECVKKLSPAKKAKRVNV